MMETQLVYLTATLRPQDEVEFSRLMGLPEDKEGCHWFRGSTRRHNVGYRVVLYDGKEEAELIERLVEEKKGQYPLPGQIVIYCSTVELTKELAKRLGCLCYYREVGDAEEKKAIVRQLCEGKEQVFTATNALGLGVDAPSIRVVIHVGVVRKLKDYAQESGRAGRDGLGSEAIILHRAKYDRAGRYRGLGLDESVEEEMGEFIGTKGCMRLILDRVMDGQEDGVVCSKGEEKCYRCEEREELEAMVMREGREEEEELRREGIMVEEEEEEELRGGGIMVEGDSEEDDSEENDLEEDDSEEDDSEEDDSEEDDSEEDFREIVEIEQEKMKRKRLAMEERRLQCQEVLEIELLKEMLEVWGSGCQWCRAKGKSEGECLKHSIESCKELGIEDIHSGLKVMSELIRWEKYSCCFGCGIPQGICSSWKMKEDGSGWVRVTGVRCQFEGVLVKSIISLFRAWPSEMEEWILGLMKLEGCGLDEESKELSKAVHWMCKKVRWGELESNKMCIVFVRFLQDRGLTSRG